MSTSAVDRCGNGIPLLSTRPRYVSQLSQWAGKYLCELVRGRHAARAFAVEDAYALDVVRAARRGDVWVQSLAQLRTMQMHAEGRGATRFGATMIECAPLAVQTVPFGTGPTRGPIQEDWKEVLVKDIREGRRVTRLLAPQPLFGM